MLRRLALVVALACAAPALAVDLGDDGLHKPAWLRETFKDLRDDLAEANAEGKRLMIIGSGQNMGVVVGDLACAKVSSLYGGLPWTYGLQSKRPSTTGRSALISLTAFLDHTG
jgi:hypothetical protein